VPPPAFARSAAKSEGGRINTALRDYGLACHPPNTTTSTYWSAKRNRPVTIPAARQTSRRAC